MYSLIYSAKLNGVDPRAWLADVLARIDNVHGGGGNSDAGREVGLRWSSDLAARVELRISHP